LSEISKSADAAEIEQSLQDISQTINATGEKHARIGAVIVSEQSWTIDNGFLTPTLKIKRDQVEAQFGEQAMQLATQSAEQGKILVVRV